MIVRVDPQRCQGHGLCHTAAPDVFELDELGFCATRETAVAGPDRAAAERGAQSCPEQAITVDR